MEKKCLFIGRFQPPHLGYLDALRQIIFSGITKILIGVGSADKEYETINYLNQINAKDRLLKIYDNEVIKPSVAVDGLILTEIGKLVLIKRKNPPLGYSLPGGFVNYGEDPRDAVLREIKEELSIDSKIEKLIGVYGDPLRDPRSHVITIVYKLQITGGNLQAGDDAKEFILIDPQKYTNYELAFDHKEIIGEFNKKSIDF